MAKFFLKWWADFSRLPATPQEGAKFRFKMIEMVKADLSAGKLTEWGSFSNGKDGYAIIGERGGHFRYNVQVDTGYHT
jgi:hypothetical protein